MSRLRLALASLVVLLSAVAWSPEASAVGVSPGVATAVQREQAQALFVRGKQFFDAKKYADALAQFQAAMEVVASPNARLYVARCLRETGKLVEAYVEFDRTAVEANEHAREDSRYARTGASARTERDAIAPRIGFVDARIEHSTDATTLRIGSETIRQAGWGVAVPVMPGETEVSVETPPAAAIRQTVRVAAGEKKAVVIDAAGVAPVAIAEAGEASPDRRSWRPYAYAAGAVGAAGLLTFAIAGILSDSTYSDLSGACGTKPCPASKQSEVSRGQAEQTAADVGLGFALAGLATGVTLFILSMPPKKEAAPRTSPELPGAPEVSLGPGWVGLRGSF
jgi:hypothetical protein